MIKAGNKNLITDVPGILVGQAQSLDLLSGVTTIFPEEPAVAAVDVRGGGPGTRETEALNSDCVVDRIHSIVLSGGSAYGLASADGAMSWLSENQIGFRLDSAIIPVVPAAVLFDLLNGGNKKWGHASPYFEMGYQSLENRSSTFDLGNAGAGTGSHAGPLKGGLGSASFVFRDQSSDITVGAVAAVNSMGAVTRPNSPVFWAAPFEQNEELGNQTSLPLPGPMEWDYPFRLPNGKNTTLVTVATDAILDKSQAKRVAMMAHDGLARAIRPVHSPLDGDTVFVLSTEKQPLSDPVSGIARLGMLAADCVARAIARGVYEAESLGPWEGYRSHYAQFFK